MLSISPPKGYMPRPENWSDTICADCAAAPTGEMAAARKATRRDQRDVNGSLMLMSARR
jgi:hypothetical protein